ncbi:MAG: ATP-binding cassette domain-containing protein [Proteobacteria bacterium]|nr:ATP-binding cassette domain-containing protein [Planctomycetia bacterium]NCG55887.1 ATP-binding cassette domain-containing protein [Pseudomonadota bacterium]
MIEIENLSLSFGDRRALDDVSFHVPKGAVTGFIGENGAGKTSTFRVLTTWLLPDPETVSVRVGGIDLLKDPHAACSRVGVLPEQLALPGELRVDEYLKFRSRLKGVSGNRIHDEVVRVLNAVNAPEMIRRRLDTLSQGYRQRIGLADALLGDPPVLLLDEPTRGLDPRQITQFRELIDGLRGNHTLLLSSHVLGEVEQVCDRICVISEGQIRLEEDRETWMQRLDQLGRLHLELDCPDTGAKSQVTQWLKEQPEVSTVENEGSVWSIQADRTLRTRIGKKALDEKWIIQELRSEPATLESLFLQWTGPEKKKAQS